MDPASKPWAKSPTYGDSSTRLGWPTSGGDRAQPRPPRNGRQRRRPLIYLPNEGRRKAVRMDPQREVDLTEQERQRGARSYGT